MPTRKRGMRTRAKKEETVIEEFQISGIKNRTQREDSDIPCNFSSIDRAQELAEARAGKKVDRSSDLNQQVGGSQARVNDGGKWIRKQSRTKYKSKARRRRERRHYRGKAFQSGNDIDSKTATLLAQIQLEDKEAQIIDDMEIAYKIHRREQLRIVGRVHDKGIRLRPVVRKRRHNSAVPLNEQQEKDDLHLAIYLSVYGDMAYDTDSEEEDEPSSPSFESPYSSQRSRWISPWPLSVLGGSFYSPSPSPPASQTSSRRSFSPAYSCSSRPVSLADSESSITGRRRRLSICVVCQEDYGVTRADCGHDYCQACIEDFFQRSITDDQLFPPKCCNKEIFPDIVYGILPHALMDEYLRKLEAQSSNFQTQFCVRCHDEAHGGECLNDTEIQKTLKIAEEKGWKRCHRCGRMIERMDGCNNIHCDCGHDFCYECGAQWKTCECRFWPADDSERRSDPLHEEYDRLWD